MRSWLIVLMVLNGTLAAAAQPELKIQLTWGAHSPAKSRYYVKLVPNRITVSEAQGYQLEPGDGLRDGAWQTTSGQGDTDGVGFTISYSPENVSILQDMQLTWADLIARSDPDTAHRLSLDPALRQDRRSLTVQMNEKGTQGFTVTVDQLLQNRSFWIPSLDVFLTTEGKPLAEYEKTLVPWKGLRVLDRIHSGKEASYDEYKKVWEDMGSPSYVRAQQPKPGHIVCLTWDSAIPKFGIDRGGGVWNDYGNPDRFRFWFGFGSLEDGVLDSWRGQKLEDGFPVVITAFEKEGVRYEVEQFAYPLHGTTSAGNGDIPMVLLQKLRLSNLTGKDRQIGVTLNHQRALPGDWNKNLVAATRSGQFLVQDQGRHDVLFALSGMDSEPTWSGVTDYQNEMRRMNATVFVDLPANGSKELVMKLPSPRVPESDVSSLLQINYAEAKAATVRFWKDWMEQGASFEVSEKAVNDLYRANLWHSLRLPRRHGASGSEIQIDLPYSNFAYSQTGTPWPINQAVYVDYMIYDLRGYFGVSTEELAVMFRNNQEQDGHVGGFANWFVYTPAMLFAVAKHYELSGNRATLEKLLPSSLKALDWSLSQLKDGLPAGPLNDVTGSGVWAFNQAYLYAGLSEFGKVLHEIGHPRAGDCLAAARGLRQSIDVAFHTASMHSPLVQLRDHTWIPYVPSEASIFGRIFSQWYPADVDTGAVHLARLNAIDPSGDLATSLLNDHEDNLFLFGGGLANEPVYNQQAAAYLLRDDPEAAIRVFYSLMAGGFSHSTLEPVEHRWTHGQYFGPPSTDGAWAESYRNMLVRETGDGMLFVGQAAPRAWLEDGKKIEVRNAPTEYGEISFRILSEAGRDVIHAELEMPARSHPHSLLVRFRHPARKPIRSVVVNGKPWIDFDASKEWVQISSPNEARYVIEAKYE